MSDREKILVGLMLLAIVYGAYTYFFSPQRRPGTVNEEPEQEALKAFIVQVAEKSKTGLSKSQAYALQKAQADWKQDPLIQIEPRKPKEKDTQQFKLKSNILYTGFLQMGDKRLAIINGVEYETGDKLEPGGFVIRSIFPNHVVIAAPGGSKKTITLPMEEAQ